MHLQFLTTRESQTPHFHYRRQEHLHIKLMSSKGAEVVNHSWLSGLHRESVTRICQTQFRWTSCDWLMSWLRDTSKLRGLHSVRQDQVEKGSLPNIIVVEGRNWYWEDKPLCWKVNVHSHVPWYPCCNASATRMSWPGHHGNIGLSSGYLTLKWIRYIMHISR